MKCVTCKKKLRQDDKLMPIYKLVENEKRGDFVTFDPESYAHLHHFTSSEVAK